MKRRDVLRLLAGAVMTVPHGASAQTPAKTYRLASLTAGSPVPVKSPNGAMLFSALAKNGYTLGQNLEYQPYGAAMQIAFRNWPRTLPRIRSMLRSSWGIQPQRL